MCSNTLNFGSNTLFLRIIRNSARSFQMDNKKVTIKDIAKMAEVSPGTVDRVLHNRGKVSKDKKKRIDEVLREINYQPNLIAKTLKNNKIYSIQVLIPDPSTDEYWQKVEWGVKQGLREYQSFGIRIETHYFDISNETSFEKISNHALNSKPDGILIAPMHRHQSDTFFKKCIANEIPYVIFNSPQTESNPVTFIGQDLYQSGRVAAELITLSQKSKGRILLLHIDETPDNAIHILNKENGARDFLGEKNYPDDLIQSITLFHDDSVDLEETIRTKVVLDKDISGVIISTSKSYEVAEIFKECNPDCVIVGYDLISRNTRLLEAGVITFLINQSPIQQSYLGVQRFVDKLVFEKEVRKQELLPIQVVTPENLNSIQIQRFGSVRL